MNTKCKTSNFFLVLALVFLLTACASKPTQPKAGHWEGSDPDISFDVTVDGNLVNFLMSVPYGASDCDIRIASITLPEQGSLVMDLTSTETLSAGYVTGEFSAEKIAGKYSIEMCNMNISLMPDASEEQDWTAEWKNP